MDPRIARTREAVIRAATELLVEGGPTAVTVDAIVARSGVAKSTIYRHWESRDDILVGVLLDCAPDFAVPDPALGFEGGLHHLAEQIRQMLIDPNWARIMPALMVLKQHLAEVEALNERLGKDQRNVLEELLEHGLAEGLLADAIETEEAAALIVGPMMFAALTGQVELTQPFCRRVVDSFLAAHTRHPAPT